MGGKIIKFMIGVVCEKEGEVRGDTWVSDLSNLIVHAVRQGVGRGGGAGLTEKMMRTVSTC